MGIEPFRCHGDGAMAPHFVAETIVCIFGRRPTAVANLG